MKALFVFLLCSAVVFTACDKEFGAPCLSCTTHGGDLKSSILLTVHVSVPQGLYTPEEATQIVDVADLELLDASTKKVVARKQLSVKGNGDVVDGESVSGNSFFLYSSQVKVEAPWDLYLISFHVRSQANITKERVIDCSSGSAAIRFDY